MPPLKKSCKYKIIDKKIEIKCKDHWPSWPKRSIARSLTRRSFRLRRSPKSRKTYLKRLRQLSGGEPVDGPKTLDKNQAKIYFMELYNIFAEYGFYEPITSDEEGFVFPAEFNKLWSLWDPNTSSMFRFLGADRNCQDILPQLGLKSEVSKCQEKVAEARLQVLRHGSTLKRISSPSYYKSPK